MAENVKVIVRCRPMNKKESEMNCKPIVTFEDCMVNLNNPTDINVPAKVFSFDNAYDQDAPTEAIYNDICYSLVESVLEGYNSTIFAYGQTGCGKSHTMQGPANELINKNLNDKLLLSQRGIISRSFEHIFEAIAVSTDVRYLALVSFLEIYNETIRDLLHPDVANTNLQLKELPSGGGIIVQNLTTHTVHNAQECENLLAIGAKNRIVGSTLMNAGSSRSHSIFTISLEQISTTTVNANGTINNESPAIKKGKLNLVDLAGSERQNKTGTTGERFKEATKINLSLSALGNVISALVDGKTKHIPYRDAKLTRLLQDSLGGNTKTLMVACISPSEYNYDETLSTLRYASRAKNIHNKPRINEDPKDTMLREYQEEINELKKLLNLNNNNINNGIINNNTNNNNNNLLTKEPIENVENSLWLNSEKEKLKIQFDEETKKLKIEHEMQKKEKDELVKNMETIKSEYEEQLKTLMLKNQLNNNNNNNNNNNSNINYNDLNQHEQLNNKTNSNNNNFISNENIIERLTVIKNALIGGEKADDIQLKEKRNKKKIDAQHRLSALAHALSRVEQSEDRDLLQGHYASIQHELQFKTDALKKQRQKVRALEREVTDLQAEFQLDRADYLETIRRLEKNLKFYQQLIDKALPLLRKDGRFWDVDIIRSESIWNDDLKKWKLPEESLCRMKLPPAVTEINRNGSTSLTAPGRLERTSSSSSANNCLLCNDLNDTNETEFNQKRNFINHEHHHHHDDDDDDESDFLMKKWNTNKLSSATTTETTTVTALDDDLRKYTRNEQGIECSETVKKLQSSDGNSIVDSYFRPRRATELIHKSRTFNTWKQQHQKHQKHLQQQNGNDNTDQNGVDDDIDSGLNVYDSEQLLFNDNLNGIDDEEDYIDGGSEDQRKHQQQQQQQKLLLYEQKFPLILQDYTNRDKLNKNQLNASWTFNNLKNSNNNNNNNIGYGIIASNGLLPANNNHINNSQFSLNKTWCGLPTQQKQFVEQQQQLKGLMYGTRQQQLQQQHLQLQQQQQQQQQHHHLHQPATITTTTTLLSPHQNDLWNFNNGNRINRPLAATPRGTTQYSQ